MFQKCAGDFLGVAATLQATFALAVVPLIRWTQNGCTHMDFATQNVPNHHSTCGCAQTKHVLIVSGAEHMQFKIYMLYHTAFILPLLFFLPLCPPLLCQGMAIAVGKLTLYTACGGLHPAEVRWTGRAVGSTIAMIAEHSLETCEAECALLRMPGTRCLGADRYITRALSSLVQECRG